ncbi:penicillin-binding protein 2 [Candidatus Kaiserbacteria bacterium]|nr:penicillin-binding protein 2 [Candidatus Kaiserbacteria bacterium]
MRSDPAHLRIRALGAVSVLIALLLLVRLYFVQIVHGADYRDDASAQYVSHSPDTETRGSIFFTTKDGDHPTAAQMNSGWRIAIKPADIVDARATYDEIASKITLDRDRFFSSAAKKDDPYEEVAFRVKDAAAQAIRAKKLPGVLLVQDQWRFYPAAELSAQTIGFVGYQGNTKTGVYGLERYYNDTLAEHVSGKQMNPYAEIFANAGALFTNDSIDSLGGASIVTSIEPSVERELEDTLDGVMKTYTPRLAAGIVMDPTTGEVVALGVRPSYNPNTYNLVSDARVFSNPLVEGRYEMGSIMKALTMAAGIDTGAVTPETTYNDTGCITKSKRQVCNYDFRGRGVVSMQEVLNQSLNVGASFVADTMGHAVFARYVHAYGLGDKTGIDIPSEVMGDISSIDRNSDVDFASASFGQGIAVSGIEMIRALSALANGGKLPSPHIVTAIRYQSGVTRAIPVAASVQVLKPESVDTVTDMLVKVYDNALLKGALKQVHYSIAAKTGTAQIASPGGGGYYSDRFLHSFFGYFPAHQPRFIVFLFAVEPHGAEFASATLARPFLDIAKFLINYYDIPPDR